MIFSSYPQRGTHCVLAAGPQEDDAGFAAEWLQAAAEADRLLQVYLSCNPELEINYFEMDYPFHFSAWALEFISMWRVGGGAFSIDLWDDCFEKIFYVMAEVGFFAKTGAVYQMRVPTDLNADHIKSALLEIAATQDSDGSPHLEQLLDTMTIEMARDLGGKLIRRKRNHDWRKRFNLVT